MNAYLRQRALEVLRRAGVRDDLAEDVVCATAAAVDVSGAKRRELLPRLRAALVAAGARGALTDGDLDTYCAELEGEPGELRT